MAENLELEDFIGEKLEKIFVKYWDLSVYEDDEDVVKTENEEITQIENIAFVFGEKAIVINFLDEGDELTIEYKEWIKHNEGWTEIQVKNLTKYIGNELSFLWRSINLRLELNNNYKDMVIFSFKVYPDILVYASSGELEIFESHKISMPPKTS